MIAIIKTKNDTAYPAPVVAVRWDGWNTEVVVPDEMGTHFVQIMMWKPRRSVYIIQEEEPFSYKEEKWEGDAAVLTDKELCRKLKKGKPVSSDAYPQLNPYAKSIVLPEWFSVNTQKDADDFIWAAGALHDAELTQVTQTGNDLEIMFDTTWDCHVTVRFMAVTEESVVHKVGLILDSEMVLQDDGICFAITDGCAGDIGGIQDWETPFGTPYIKCQQVLWKINVLTDKL